MFDSELYHERRSQGLRGQENLIPEPQLARWTREDFEAKKCTEEEIGEERTSGVEMQMTKQGLRAYPRRLRRQRVRFNAFTKKGAMRGTEKFDIRQRRRYYMSKTIESGYRYGETNHERVRRQRSNRLAGVA